MIKSYYSKKREDGLFVKFICYGDFQLNS